MRKLLVFVAVLVPQIASAAPALTIEQAAKIAQTQLKERGVSGQVYITSIVLSSGRSPHWSVEWSSDITLESGRKESGLQIDMQGGVAVVVSGPANRDAVTGAFQPNGATGLQNHRTRSDRPSILDLKH